MAFKEENVVLQRKSCPALRTAPAGGEDVAAGGGEWSPQGQPADLRGLGALAPGGPTRQQGRGQLGRAPELGWLSFDPS